MQEISRTGAPPVARTEGHDLARRVGAVSPLWVVMLLTVTAFAHVCTMDFVDWDDPLHVYQNPYFDPVSPSHLLHFWRRSYEGMYIPLSYMAYGLLATLARRPTLAPTPSGGVSDLNPHVFHAAGLVLHLLNVLLVFLILRRLGTRDWAAAGGALLFGLHPVQVESVAWISELRGVLGASFSLLAVWQYLGHAAALRDGSDTRRVWGRALRASLAFGAALLAKPSVVTVPLIAAALDYGLMRRGTRSRPWVLGVWLLMAGGTAVVAHFAQPTEGAYVVPVWLRPFVAGDALAFYLTKLLLPLRLGVDYGRTPQSVLSRPWGYLTWVGPGLLLAAAWGARRRAPAVTAAAGVFVLGLLPNLGLVPFVFQRFSTVADRYLYLAMLGPALGAAWGLESAARRWAGQTVALAAMLVLIPLTALTATQVGYWDSGLRLFRHALDVNPHSSGMHLNLGRVYDLAGQNALAEQHYREALRLLPDSAEAHLNLGTILGKHQDFAGAVREFRAALRLHPGQPEALCSLGQILASQGQAEAAIGLLRQALRGNPRLTQAHYYLGLALAERGRTAEAAAQWREVVRERPDYGEVRYNLGVALLRLGDRPGAVAQFREAVRLQPDSAAALQQLAAVTRRDGP